MALSEDLAVADRSRTFFNPMNKGFKEGGEHSVRCFSNHINVEALCLCCLAN